MVKHSNQCRSVKHVVFWQVVNIPLAKFDAIVYVGLSDSRSGDFHHWRGRVNGGESPTGFSFSQQSDLFGRSTRTSDEQAALGTRAEGDS